MARTLLLVPAMYGAGLTGTAMGFVRAFDRSQIPVGYLKPIEQRTPKLLGVGDHSGDLIRVISSLDPPEPVPATEVEELLANGQSEGVMERIIEMAEPVLASHEIVIVQGLAPGPGLTYSTRLNLEMAKALDADVILVASARSDQIEHTPERIADLFAMAGSPYRSGESVRVVGCVVNRMNPDDRPAIEAALAEHDLRLVGASPMTPELTWLRTRDIATALSAEILHPGDLDRRIADTLICAQSAPSVLPLLQDNSLLVVPGDRDDIIMAACLAALNGIRLSGLLLTAGMRPEPAVWELTQAARDSSLPILLSADYTYPTATALYRIPPEVPADDVQRAELLATTMADGVDREWRRSVADKTSPSRKRISPAAFRHHLTKASRAADKRIVLPEGDEPRTIEAATICAEKGIARPVLLADPASVAEICRRHSLSLPETVEVLNPEDHASRFVDRLVELRAHKGMTRGMALNQLADRITVGTLMLESGEVDGLVSGAVHTTAHTIRPALQLIKTAPDAKLVSSVFFMLLPDDVFVYGDCAVNPDPTAEELADIALQSAASARAFGIEPRVAMISFSTGDSGAGSDVEKVALATKLIHELDPQLAVDGPLQYDAAVVESVGQSKRPGSNVAGRANVFIFPDLNTGNTTYKAVQRSAGVVSIGPMLQGLAKPVNDLSRGALVEDIVYTISLTAIQAAAL